MKNFIFIFSLLTAFSCSGHSNNSATPDSINAIDQHPLQDTTVSPNPDGYAPPNAEVDTSQRIKDSIDSSRH